MLAYPLTDTLASGAAAAILEDDFAAVAAAVVAAADSGELAAALGEADGYKGWVKALGKAQGRKGKRLFMPLRLALTGRTQGPEVGDQLAVLAAEGGAVAEAGALVPLAARIEALRAWLATQ